MNEAMLGNIQLGGRVSTMYFKIGSALVLFVALVAPAMATPCVLLFFY